MYSAIKSDESILLSIKSQNAWKIADALTQGRYDKSTVTKMLVPKNIDIILFVNELITKRKLGRKYLITDTTEFHPEDFIFHQCYLTEDRCNVIIADKFDSISMQGGEDCPGTKKLVETYNTAYNSIASDVLNKNSLFIQESSGIYSIIERNLGEFIVYLSWTKINEVIRYARLAAPGSTKSIEMSSSFEILERNDGKMFDLIRTLKEKKDSTFYMSDPSGNKIPMRIDGDIPNVTSGFNQTFYYDEFLQNASAYRSGTAGSLINALKSVNQKSKSMASVGVKTGIKIAKQLLADGWEIKTIGSADYFVYPKKVYVTTVYTGDRIRYTLPDDCKHLLYVYDITVPIESTLRGLNATHGVTAKGFHPHRSCPRDSGMFDEINHCDIPGNVCIGDLDGAPIEKITLLIDALSGAYTPSMMGNLPSYCIRSLQGHSIDVMSSDNSDNVKKSMKYIKPFITRKGFFTRKSFAEGEEKPIISGVFTTSEDD